MPSNIDYIELLQAALIGLQYQASEIDRKMAEIRTLIDGGRSSSAPAIAKPAKKRTLSAAARRRIAEAQRKRWAAFHKEGKAEGPAQKATPAAPARKKPRTSPAARKRVAEATKKRWAAHPAAKAMAAKKAVPARKKALPVKRRPAATKAKKAAGKKMVLATAVQTEVLEPEATA